MIMHQLAIDIETYSGTDLSSAGVYAYAEDPEFEILLIGYALDNDPVQVLDLCKDRGPARLDPVPKRDKELSAFLRLLNDPTIQKTAFNANFERTCLAQCFKCPMPPEEWSCTMVLALTLGLPGRLSDVAKVLNLSEQKMEAGTSLISYFCKPCKPTRQNNQRTRNLPNHDPSKWELFKSYCRQDVETERAIRKHLEQYPHKTEAELWALDQRINDRGIMIDKKLIENAIQINNAYCARLEQEASELTGLDNVRSVSQLKGWLSEQEGTEITSLNKKDVPELIENASCDKTQRVLEIRQKIAKSSIAKYDAMLKSVCHDDRIRGLFQFYGANRAGRWAGRLVQMQNLPRNHMPLLDDARALVREGNMDSLEILFDNIPDVLSQLIRTAFIPKPDYKFVVADFSAIEARIIAWLAGETWRQEVFAANGKIYEASAAKMFRVPVETIHKGSPLRQKGKIAELALGYGGGPKALINMGALEMGLEKEELPKLVKMWRGSNPAIVRLWSDVENAALSAVADGLKIKLQHGIEIKTESNILYIKLPSGRMLCYVNPKLETNQYNKTALTYDNTDQQTRKWSRTETYGGKLTENIVQAIARDCLAEAMLRLERAGYEIVTHVHDEVILEVPKNQTDALADACSIMGESIDWAPGLLLSADGFECSYYQKD